MEMNERECGIVEKVQILIEKARVKIKNDPQEARDTLLNAERVMEEYIVPQSRNLSGGFKYFLENQYARIIAFYSEITEIISRQPTENLSNRVQ